MMNSHLEPKPYPFAQPERFAAFFGPVTILLYLEKYTCFDSEKIHAGVRIANYGKTDLKGSVEIRGLFSTEGHE
ncbi:MAG: hypothetical protein IJV14_01140 [Lachnospiraceae bacterium]|nr:hypothetical protein [Lachnospiraceae bacterium]